MENQKHIDLAKKLARLAEQGVGGEKLNAQKLLEKIMREKGITKADIEGEQVNRYWISFERRFEQIFQQLVARVIGNNTTIWQKTKERQGARVSLNRAVDCTAAQYVELKCFMEVYFAAWDEEVRLLRRAFAMKHKLFDPNAEKRDWDDLTREEKREYDRAERMAESLKDRHVQRQIEG